MLSQADLAEENASTTFAALLRDPKKLMSIVTLAGAKLDEKIKSGEMKESEVLAEAQEMLANMSLYPGVQQMFSHFTGGQKINVAATEAQLKRRMQTSRMKERIIAKSIQRQQQRAQEEQLRRETSVPTQPLVSQEEILALFGDESSNEKPSRSANKRKRAGK